MAPIPALRTSGVHPRLVGRVGLKAGGVSSFWWAEYFWGGRNISAREEYFWWAVLQRLHNGCVHELTVYWPTTAAGACAHRAEAGCLRRTPTRRQTHPPPAAREARRRNLASVPLGSELGARSSELGVEEPRRQAPKLIAEGENFAKKAFRRYKKTSFFGKSVPNSPGCGRCAS